MDFNILNAFSIILKDFNDQNGVKYSVLLQKWTEFLFLAGMCSKQGYTLKNWVEGVSDEAFYLCTVVEFIREGVTKLFQKD